MICRGKLRPRGKPLRAFSVWALALLIGMQLAARGEDPPQRVITQVPSITEILYALGQEDRIVGVSTYCRFPEAARAKPKVGALHDLNLERVLSLAPDWIALFAGQDKVGGALQAQGCRVYYYGVETIPELLRCILEVGTEFQVQEKANALVASMTKEISDLKTALSGLPSKRVLYVVGREPGSLKQLYGVGEGTFLGEIIRIAGGVNVIEPKLGKYPVISREALLISNPEIILDGGAGELEKRNGSMAPEWEALASVKAVKERKVIPIDDPHLTIPGPTLGDTIRKIALLLHGEEARKRLERPAGD